MNIHSKLHDYIVDIKPNFDFIKPLLACENALIVIDKNLYELYKDRLFSELCENKVFIIEALEQNKTIDTALQICEVMTAIPAKRNSHLISIGGGIIQDITGFAANILYRGIHWTFVPTTLLAACDSCIGGKTSLNYKSYKNLLGTFYPPTEIYICPEFFTTLSDKDFESGLGEVVKFNIMAGKGNLSDISESMQELKQRAHQTVEKFLSRSLEFKKGFIEKDEFDKGERIFLNFAHTFGHAIETTSKYAIPHGTAVAIGMLMANRISLLRNMLSADIVETIEKLICQIVHVPLATEYFQIDTFIDAMRKDKKQTSSALTAVLLKDDMTLEIVHDLTKEEVSCAIATILQLFSVD